VGLCKTPLSLLPTRKCQKSREKSYNLKIGDIATLLKMVQKRQRMTDFPILWGFPIIIIIIIMTNVVIDLK